MLSKPFGTNSENDLIYEEDYQKTMDLSKHLYEMYTILHTMEKDHQELKEMIVSGNVTSTATPITHKALKDVVRLLSEARAIHSILVQMKEPKFKVEQAVKLFHCFIRAQRHAELAKAYDDKDYWRFIFTFHVSLGCVLMAATECYHFVMKNVH